MTTLSLGRESWLNKLERIGNLSMQQPEIVFNNLGHIISMEMLMDCANGLDGNKAVGVDGIGKAEYVAKLELNAEALLRRIRRGTYEPQKSRLVEIPKDDGSMRPLAISCFEDKVAQEAVSRILSAIYEPQFLDSSFGYRPNRSAHDAVKQVLANVRENRNGAIVEIDLRKFFTSVPWDPLMEMLEKRISDRRFLALIAKLIRAPIEGQENICGVPQGSIISPILSNIYLHEVIDSWIKSLDETYFKGRCRIVRYCDDMVFTFEHMFEAQAFYRTLPKRLAKFGLSLHEDKSSIQVAGLTAIGNLWKQGEKAPRFKFVGFEFQWVKSRRGFPRLRVKSLKTRLNKTHKRIKEHLMRHRNAPNHMVVLTQVKRVVQGWVNYHAVSDNGSSVFYFINRTKHLILRWFNRRGKKGTMTWVRLEPILASAGIVDKFCLKPLYSLGS